MRPSLKMGAYEDIHNVKYVGPGFWVAIHLLAAKAQTDADVKRFKDFMDFLSEHCVCEKCRKHIKKFLDTHPYENYTKDYIDGKEVGYFRLTWYMHSMVNERLGKPFFPFETAYDIYFNKNTTCMEVCPGMIEDVPVKDETRSMMIARHSKKVSPAKATTKLSVSQK